MTPQVKPSARETRRLQTRQRRLDAAVAEFKRVGMAGADVKAIVAAAGVAHGTFFFSTSRARSTSSSNWRGTRRLISQKSSPGSSIARTT